MGDSNAFYETLTPYYHLIYPDWEASIRRQATMLDSVINEYWRDVSTILDVSCGIGTQALGLAELGYSLTASDLSPHEVERARKEAASRSLPIEISVADMREAHQHHGGQFDVVISCDNSIPHLLTDEQILRAFQQFYECTRPGGGCIISVRDYDAEDLSRRQLRPYGIREESGTRWVIWQVWEPRPPNYELTFYFVADQGGPECATYCMRSTYYAIGIPRLMTLMAHAGFTEIQRLDDRFFQPMIIGTRGA